MKRREFLALAAASASLHAQAPNRTVVVGDVHGDLDSFVNILTMAGILDGEQKWAGGTAQLVQIGDVCDRGPRTSEVIELLIRLEKEARKAKGRVWCLIGNHEAMRMTGDLRYVPASEYESFSNKKSEQKREAIFQAHLKTMASQDDKERPDLGLGYRQKWEKEHPLGQTELLLEYSPEGRFGNWVLNQKAALVLDGTLYVHAGISPKYVDWSASRIDSRVKEELRLGKYAPENASADPEGPLWFRGLADGPENELAAHVDQVLAKHKVTRIIVGHTPTRGAGVVSRFGGKVLLCDVGLSAYYGGRKACVVLEAGSAWALDRGQKTQLK